MQQERIAQNSTQKFLDLRNAKAYFWWEECVLKNEDDIEK